jgi:hypothetical protein
MAKYEMSLKTGGDFFRVIMKADVNDGDYLTTINTYSQMEFEDGLVYELIELSKIVGKGHALETYVEQGYANVPFDTQTGEPCHTLERLTVEFISSEGSIYEVAL